MDAWQLDLRTTDPGRFGAALWAPISKRVGVMAIYALDVELARQATKGEEPTLAQIRLTWWRDALTGGQEHGGVPLLRAVSRAGLSGALLVELVDAYSSGLSGPCAEGLANQLAMRFLGGTSLEQEAARAAGAAWAMARRGEDARSLVTQARAVRAVADRSRIAPLLLATLADNWSRNERGGPSIRLLWARLTGRF